VQGVALCRIGAILEEETIVADKLPFFSGGSVYRAYLSRDVPVIRSRVIVETPAESSPSLQCENNTRSVHSPGERINAGGAGFGRASGDRLSNRVGDRDRWVRSRQARFAGEDFAGFDLTYWRIW